MHLWNELEDQNILLSRNKQTQINYDNFRVMMTSKYGSIEKYLLTVKFHNRKNKEQPFCLEINDFPYETEHDVSHWVLWDFSRNQIYPNEEHLVLQQYKNYVYLMFDPISFDIKFRINPPKWRTVIGIPHCHIFIRLRL